MNKIFIILFFFFLCFPASAEIINPDKPLKGEYVFPLEKCWEISEAGPDAFAYIRQIAVSDEGNLYLHDPKNQRFYIFNKDKKFIRAFGKKGEGPGEIKLMEMSNIFAVNDKFIAVDIDKLHYFSAKGDFLHSIPNHMFRKRPVLFLDENRFISAPLFKAPGSADKSTILLNDLKNNKEKPLAYFSAVERPGRRGPGSRRRLSIAFRGVTAMMAVGYHEEKVYFGMNDRYLITITDLEGKIINTFGIKRQKKKISKQTKERLATRMRPGLTDSMKARIVENIPDEATYFDAIAIHNGLIYVYLSDPGITDKAQVDIFSPEGKYLYRAFIKIAGEYTINPPPLIKGNHLYLIVTDDEGEFRVVKYKIDLPR